MTKNICTRGHSTVIDLKPNLQACDDVSIIDVRDSILQIILLDLTLKS